MSHAMQPLSAEFLADPYPHVARQREEAPVVYDPELDFWIVTRHEDLEYVFLNQDLFSAVNVQAPLYPLCDEATAILKDRFDIVPVMSNADQPAHIRYRRRLARAFSTRRMRVLTPIVELRCSEILDSFASDGKGDLMRQLCYPLPALTIFAMIGFPHEDTDRIKAWCADKLAINWGRPSREHQIEAAGTMVAFWEYCIDFVRRRREEPADDLTTDLMQQDDASDALSDREIASILFGLSFAGHETTTNQTANCIRNVLEAGLWETLRRDRSLVPAVIEESLRYDSSVIAWRRITTRPVTIGGVDIPAGAKLFLSIAAANRDPRVFGEPDAYLPGRERVRDHLSFGKGIHLCLGRELSRIEMGTILNALLARFDTLELDDREPLSFPANITFRGPVRLMARWTLASAGDSPDPETPPRGPGVRSP